MKGKFSLLWCQEREIRIIHISPQRSFSRNQNRWKELWTSLLCGAQGFFHFIFYKDDPLLMAFTLEGVDDSEGASNSIDVMNSLVLSSRNTTRKSLRRGSGQWWERGNRNPYVLTRVESRLWCPNIWVSC